MMKEFMWLHESEHGIVANPTGELWIQPEKSKRSKSSVRAYAPMRNPALFRTFIDVNGDQDLIVDFANRFGLLTSAVAGESLAAWETAITDLQAVVDFWNYLHEPPTETDCKNHGLLTSVGVFNISVDKFNSSSHELRHLQEQINKRILGVRPMLTYSHDGASKTGLSLQLMPTNLLEAMWLQFAHAVASGKSFRKCTQCNLWFEISPKVARSDKIFCREACKAKAYRLRQAAETSQSGEGLDSRS